MVRCVHSTRPVPAVTLPHDSALSRVLSYGIALAATGVAVVMRVALDPWLGDSLPLVTLFAAVALTAWWGGWRPALSGALIGIVACLYLFVSPRGEIGLDRPANAVGALAYVFTCGVIIAFAELMRRAQRSARQEREVLRVTLASIGDGVIATDLRGHVVYLNAEAEALTGWPLAAAHDRPLPEVFRT